MAKNYNLGTINFDVAMKSILSSGGGISEKTKADGNSMFQVIVQQKTDIFHMISIKTVI